MIDRTKLFTRSRSSIFHGVMSQSQVDGTNSILDGFEKAYPQGDLRWIAYILATVFHETAATMQPIAEYGKGKGRPYGVVQPNGHVYYGRGYVQLTWPNNYKVMSPVVGVDLFADPDEAMKPDIAAKIMFYGMEHGTFTGRKLADYFTPHKTDWVHAREIINGMDCAAAIAGYAIHFNDALNTKATVTA